MMQMVDQRINFVVFVVVLSEPMNFLLSISPGKEKLETACMGAKKKSLTSVTFTGYLVEAYIETHKVQFDSTW